MHLVCFYCRSVILQLKLVQDQSVLVIKTNLSTYSMSPLGILVSMLWNHCSELYT